MNCTLCGAALTTMADAFYFICPTCGAYVKDPKHYVSALEEKKVYQTHNNDVEDPRYQQFTSPITHAILAHFGPKHLGLDYGCGTGPVVAKQLTDRGYRVKLFDPYFFPDYDYLNCRYDYIFSCEVFEHFQQPAQEIEKLLQLLNPNGKLLVMTHLYDQTTDFANWYYRKDPTHVFIYTRQTIAFIARQRRLAIETLTDRFFVLRKIADNDAHTLAQGS